MADKVQDRARFQTVMDAIVAANLIVPDLADGERVEAIRFWQEEGGGWFWSMATARTFVYGNAVRVSRVEDDPLVIRHANGRKVLEAGMAAQMGQVDHLAEAMKHDSKPVGTADTEGGNGPICRECGVRKGGHHQPECPLAYPQTGETRP